MDWQIELIRLYVYIFEHYHTHLWVYCQRMSNNSEPEFTDIEVITIYLWGVMKKRRAVKDIYEYTHDHLGEWFPHLPTYFAYIQRLNQLGSLLMALVEQIQLECPKIGALKEIMLIDSMPIIMANNKRSSKAKVAKEFANKGFCASKGLYYYGVKIHILAFRKPGTLPVVDFVSLTPASEHDLPTLKTITRYLENGQLFADMAYMDELLDQILKHQNFLINTPVKKEKGQKHDPYLFDKLLSTAVSRVRQPIESLFNWINEKTAIQIASKVRSFNGLMVHVFGRLAAAMLILAFNS